MVSINFSITGSCLKCGGTIELPFSSEAVKLSSNEKDGRKFLLIMVGCTNCGEQYSKEVDITSMDAPQKPNQS